MRAAFFTPLPPEPTGIGDYSYELLEELRELIDVVAVVRDDLVGIDRAPEGVEVVGISSVDELSYDLPVYQMGNNPKYHRYLFGRAMDVPGLLVMHDPSVADFYAETCWGTHGSTFRFEVTYDNPAIGPDDPLPEVEIGEGRRDFDRMQLLLARRLVSSNIRTLVNSEAVAALYRDRYTGTEVAAINLPAPVLEEADLDTADDEGFLFGVFGGINYYKRIEPIVEAFLEVHAEYPHSRMVIAGRADDRPLERRLRRLAGQSELGGCLELRTRLSLRDLEQSMTECDVAISLRWPTAGEMSATLMRALGAGRASIVSDVLQFRELDEAFCWRVPIEPGAERATLIEMMREAIRDPARCRSAGLQAREFVRSSATYRVVAEAYAQHIAECAPSSAERRVSHHRRIP